MSILFAVLLFSLLIFVHELGHFAAAKLSGVQVNEFSMFMGPALWKKQLGETLYSVRLIPMGGYCAMEGEDGGSDNPRSFDKAAWWKRFLILVSGAAMNFLFGVLLMVLFTLPIQRVAVPVIESLEPFSTVTDLKEGDRILEIDGEKVYVFSDFSLILAVNKGDTHDMVVEREGQKVHLPNLLMEKHEIVDENGNVQKLFGINFSTETLDTAGKLRMAWAQTKDTVRNVRLSLQMLFTGKVGMSEVSGPVGLVQQMSQAADAAPSKLDALVNMLYMGGFIAINLAVMNLLPIPALDGGRVESLLITTAVEGLTGKKIDPKYEGWIHGAGMMLLLGLMALVMFKDIIFLFK